MECQVLFSRKNKKGDNLYDMSNPIFWDEKKKKKISKCHLLKFLSSMQSIKVRKAWYNIYRVCSFSYFKYGV